MQGINESKWDKQEEGKRNKVGGKVKARWWSWKGNAEKVEENQIVNESLELI